jgi:membrane protease YdiL (CAAX protease family)
LSDGEAPGAPLPATPGRRPRIAWGIGDAIAAWFAGLVVSVIAAAAVTDEPRPTQLLVLLAVQDGTVIAWLAAVARRKGLGSLRADFGFTFLPERGGGLTAAVGWVLTGVGLQLASLLPISLLVSVHGEDAKQDVVNIADRAQGLQVPLIILGVAVLAPVTEELLFRGALLRALQRRMTPDWAVFVSALVFGLVHLLGDPSIGSLIAFPAIMLLGLVSGYQAVRTGDLSRSIMLHIGFNALSALLLFA